MKKRRPGRLVGETAGDALGGLEKKKMQEYSQEFADLEDMEENVRLSKDQMIRKV
jgi:hypothetical protein